jgi:hypothetical protein
MCAPFGDLGRLAQFYPFGRALFVERTHWSKRVRIVPLPVPLEFGEADN